jgi:hypothetical protein
VEQAGGILNKTGGILNKAGGILNKGIFNKAILLASIFSGITITNRLGEKT